MRNLDFIKKLNILGIYSSKQIAEKDLNYWWQLAYQEERREQDYLYQINDILNDFSDINIRELKSILDTNNSSVNEKVKNNISINNIILFVKHIYREKNIEYKVINEDKKPDLSIKLEKDDDDDTINNPFD